MTRKKEQVPPGLKGTAYEIWLAGLGAFNIAGEEGGKLFKSLVAKGREQKETNQEWLEAVTERAKGLKGDAQALLGRVTTPLEDGLAAAMQTMGVPTRKEIVKLTHRVEELTKHVTKAKAASTAKPKPKPRAAAPAKPKPRPKTAAKPVAKPRRKTAETATTTD